jgi:3-methylfumaryl-CoA hydratase
VQNIVYRNPAPAGASLSIAQLAGAAESHLWQVTFRANEVMLFRYSALTFNGHRIHYDKDYATKEEGYPGLVVHGPLTATLLMQAVTRQSPSDATDQPRLRHFAYRGVAPLFVHETVTLAARRQGDGSLALSARKTDGTDVMTARAELRS